MRKTAFRPTLKDALEKRVVPSLVGTGGLAPLAVARPKPTKPPLPALRTGALVGVNQGVDSAYAIFHGTYVRAAFQLARSGNRTRFLKQLSAGAGRLKQALDQQAMLLPGNRVVLAATLSARVDGLVGELSGGARAAAASLIAASQSGAQADVGAYVQDEVAKGFFTQG